MPRPVIATLCSNRSLETGALVTTTGGGTRSATDTSAAPVGAPSVDSR
jgi:hypothetical protein